MCLTALLPQLKSRVSVLSEFMNKKKDLDYVLQRYIAYLKMVYDKDIEPQWVKRDMNAKFHTLKGKLVSLFPKLDVLLMDSDLRYLSVFCDRFSLNFVEKAKEYLQQDVEEYNIYDFIDGEIRKIKEK